MSIVDETVIKFSKNEFIKKPIKSIKNFLENKKINMEVELMHLLKEWEAQFGNYKILERDREKIEEGREEGILLTKKVLKLSNSGYTISQIAKECNISEDEVRRILE